MSVEDELEKLKKLHDAGTITDEQYERARAKLLDEAPAVREDRRDEPHGEDRRPRRRERDEPDEFDDEDEPARRRPRKKAREWAMALHLSLFAGHLVPFGGIIAPIVIWQTQKAEMPELDQHGKNAVNWVITFVISLCVFVPLSFVFVGIPFLIAAVVLNVVFPIIAALKANDGEVWKYPLAISFIK